MLEPLHEAGIGVRVMDQAAVFVDEERELSPRAAMKVLLQPLQEGAGPDHAGHDADQTVSGANRHRIHKARRLLALVIRGAEQNFRTQESPQAGLCGKARELFQKSGASRALLSITHSKEYAVAVVVLEG